MLPKQILPLPNQSSSKWWSSYWSYHLATTLWVLSISYFHLPQSYLCHELNLSILLKSNNEGSPCHQTHSLLHQGNSHPWFEIFITNFTHPQCLCDANWVGCPLTWRITSGFCIYLESNCFNWASKKHPTISHSSAKAEYHALAIML